MNRFIISAVLFTTFAACEQTEPSKITNTQARAVVENYADIALASYDDAVLSAKALQSSVDAFLASPSEAGLADCRSKWLASRIPYVQTEAYRFYGGPIDSNADNYVKLINSWPVNAANIDYVQNPDAPQEALVGGVVNDIAGYPEITREVLLKSHLSGGATDVKLGYHVIEFLLWGQDMSATGPGQRSWQDYAGNDANQGRRGQYLKVATDLLVAHLEAVKRQWEPGSGQYRANFTASVNSSDAITNMLNGMGKLTRGELANRQIRDVLDAKGKETENASFSDNTKTEYSLGELGIYNVYIGRYKRIDGTTIDGPGIDELVKTKSPSVNDATMKTFDAATAALEALPEPVDQRVSTDESAFLAAFAALQAQADQLITAANSFGIKLTLPERNE